MALFWLVLMPARAQLTVEACYEKARDHYPMLKQYGLIEQAQVYNLANAARGYWPQVSISGKATYQSDVTKIPIEVPGMVVPTQSKDQYQANVEVNQSIWDGGVVRSQKKAASAQASVEKQQLEVDLYTLRERVNELFFGALLLDAQLKQNALYQQELQRNYDQVKSFIENGVAGPADLDAVRVEQLKARQLRVELQTMSAAYRQMLSLMTGVEVSPKTVLSKPVAESTPSVMQVSRPELQFFAAQEAQQEVHRLSVFSKNTPRLGIFLQGGYGRPGLNMLENKFSPYYVGGFRISWNLGNFYTRKNELRQIGLNKSRIDTQRETFLYNIRLQSSREVAEVVKFRETMKDDQEIIRLQTNIRMAAEAKASNGTLSVTEMLREVTAEDQSRQNKDLHEIQWLQAIYKIKNTTNN